MVTVTREKIEITTANAVIALVLGISAVFAIFYNAQASTAKSISDLSERVATGEQKSKDMEPRLTRIENKLDGVLTSLRGNKNY